MRAVATRLARHAPRADLRSVLAALVVLPVAPEEARGAYASETEAPDLDPRRRTPADRPFMDFHEIDVAEIDRFPDALHRMYEDTLGGLVIKNVYPEAFMGEVMERLAARDAEFPRTSFPARFKAHFYGRCLDGSDPGLDEYLSDAARFRDGLGPVFEGGASFEARMEQIFRALAGGSEVALPRFTDGARVHAGDDPHPPRRRPDRHALRQRGGDSPGLHAPEHQDRSARSAQLLPDAPGARSRAASSSSTR